MSERLRGIAAAPGLALAPPWRYEPGAADGSSQRSLEEAAGMAAGELALLAARVREEGGEHEAEIFDAQALIAADESLLEDARSRVSAGMTVADAIVAAGETAAARLAALDDEALSARAADVRDVARRIARSAVGAEGPRLDRRSIAVAADLPPSVIAELPRELLAGIVLESGSRTAHAALLARALGVPTVVRVPRLLERAAGAGLLAVDGERGEVVVDPDPAERAALATPSAAGPHRRPATSRVGPPLATRDGHRISLEANIRHPEEAAPALAAGAEGIGLFRTEYMFMGRRTAPDEEEQAAAYAVALAACGDRRVVIRLVDLGADKSTPYLPAEREANPFLGVRGIRLARRDPELVLTQLRAILRAGQRTGTRPWVMAPMVADAGDMALFGDLLDRATADVPDAESGGRAIMVEVPAAVTLAGPLSHQVDLLSIGTNDLTQYLLAADRTNPSLAERQDAMHPAVTRSIQQVVAAGREAGASVAVCGELAADPLGAVVLVGLGVRELSMEPTSFDAVTRALADVGLEDAEAAALAALEAGDAAAARAAAGELLPVAGDT